MTGQHRPPPRLTVGRVAIADGAVLTLGLAFGIYTSAAEIAPQAQPVTVAAPTAVELPREPSGHGGPLTPPTFADPHVWAPSKGPVIVNGQALVRPTVVAPEPVDAPTYKLPAPIYRPAPNVPTAVAASTPTVEPEPTPVVEPTDEPTVEPEVTEPVETTPTETTEPTTKASETAEPTATVAEEVGS